MKNKFWNWIFPPAKWPVEEAKKPVVKHERKLDKDAIAELIAWAVIICMAGYFGWLMTGGH